MAKAPGAGQKGNRARKGPPRAGVRGSIRGKESPPAGGDAV